MTTARQVQSWFESAKDDTGEWRSEAKDLYDLVACRQWTAAEESEIKEKRRREEISIRPSAKSSRAF